MSCDKSSTNKNSLLSITILVVDDDPIALSIVSAMLKSSKYKDSSQVEITVTKVKNSIEALSALQVEHDNIDLVITDYHMPGMNGIELKKKIDEEYSELPVVVMSSDMSNDIEQETVSCGAMFFMAKPIKPNDLNNICQYALSSKMGKSMDTHYFKMDDDNNNDNDDDDDEDGDDNNDDGNNNNVVVRRQSITEEVVSDGELINYISDGHNGGRSVNDRTVSKGEKKKRKPNQKNEDKNDVSLRPPAPKKAKVVWTNYLHNLFLQSIRHIGLEKAVPKKILEFMNVPGLTRENIASHLQKYRIFLKKVTERGIITPNILSSRAMHSKFALGHFNSSPLSSSYLRHQPYNYPTTTPPSSNSQLGFGLGGQSRLLMPTNNLNLGPRHNPCLYGHLTRFTTFGVGNRSGITSSLPTQTENEAWRSLFPFGAPPKMGCQNSHEVHRFGQYNAGNNNSNNNSSHLSLNVNLNRNVPGPYAGIMINDKGDLIGPGNGPINITGNGFCSDLSSITRNLNNIVSSHGSASSAHRQGSGNLSSPEAATCSSSSMSADELQTLVSNAGLKKGQLQTDIAFPEINKLSIGDCLQEELVGRLPCNPSNFQINHNHEQQTEATAGNPELVDDSIFEMNQIQKDDAIEENVGQGYNKNSEGGSSSGVTLNSSAPSEVYSPAIDMNPNQEQFVGDFMEMQTSNQDWDDDDFMDSLFDYGM